MSDWKIVKDERPELGKIVLGKWENGHIEDVTFTDGGEDHIYHYLFDGESFEDEPMYWMEIPE